MLSYIHFTLDERICLQNLLSEGKSFRQIARILGRNPSTISREIKRNHTKYPKQKSNNRFNYHYWRAHILKTFRRKQNRGNVLISKTFQYNYVGEKFKRLFLPEQNFLRL